MLAKHKIVNGDVTQIFLSTNIEPIFDMTFMRCILFVMHRLSNTNDVCLVAVFYCLKQQLPVIPTAWNLLISTTFKSCYPCQSFARIIAMRQTYKQVSLLQSYWHFMLDVVINVVVCVVVWRWTCCWILLSGLCSIMPALYTSLHTEGHTFPIDETVRYFPWIMFCDIILLRCGIL